MTLVLNRDQIESTPTEISSRSVYSMWFEVHSLYVRHRLELKAMGHSLGAVDVGVMDMFQELQRRQVSSRTRLVDAINLTDTRNRESQP